MSKGMNWEKANRSRREAAQLKHERDARESAPTPSRGVPTPGQERFCTKHYPDQPLPATFEEADLLIDAKMTEWKAKGWRPRT